MASSKKYICFGSCHSHVSFSLLPVSLPTETDGDSVSFAVHDRRDSNFEEKSVNLIRIFLFKVPGIC